MIGAHPLVYEINTRCWLRELSDRAGAPLTLADVPEAEIKSWRALGFTHIWLMGVWTVLGSAYAVSDYRVSAELGGPKALRQFRARLASAGLKLILDFVPNHTGLEHPWLVDHPDLFVRTRPRQRGSFLQKTQSGPRWLAHGRDPFFDPWLDTAQLDYRNPATHAAMKGLVLNIADSCDGVRCDMAMLILNDVFAKTWGPGRSAAPEFWTEAIPAVKKIYPEFMFLAEAYWDLEARLQGLGFDYTYEKIFYDHLVARRAQELHRHLLEATPAFLGASAHFLENHDEARIASVLSPAEHRVAALLLLGLPSLRLLHEGQLSGATQKASVHLGCRPQEPVNPEICALYENLLKTIQRTFVGRGEGKVLEALPAWPDNPTAQNFVLVQWESKTGSAERAAFDLVVVNLAPNQSQCFARLQVPALEAHRWRMENLLGPENFDRDGRELRERGLYLDAPLYAAQLFRFTIAD